MIALKVKFDLLEGEGLDVYEIGYGVAPFHLVWALCMTEGLPWLYPVPQYLPFQCLGVLNGHLLSWDKAG